MSADALARVNRLAQQAGEQRIKDQSQDRLTRLAEKKFRTCFIYPLSEFEAAFGKELWGHGLPEESVTEQQRANREHWHQVRTRILNNGNTQSRALRSELELHEVRYVGYRMDFVGGRADGEEGNRQGS